MPIDVSWYDRADKILLWKIGETWDLDEYYQAVEQTKTLLAEVDQPAYTIVDATDLVHRPRTGLMSHFLKVLREIELDLLIYVRSKQSPPLVEKLLNLLVRSSSIRVKQIAFATTMEDAVRQILRLQV